MRVIKIEKIGGIFKMSKINCVAGLIIFLLLSISCATNAQSMQTPAAETPNSNTQGVAIDETRSASGLVDPENPNGSWWFEWQSGYVEWIIGMAIYTNRDLMGAEFPANYDELLSSGLMPVIFHNRYTGQPIASTKDYSSGDIYYNVDFSTGLYSYSRYQGPSDQVYDPELTNGEWLPCSGNALDSVTDGKTIKTVAVMDAETLDNPTPASEFREYYNFPADDESRVKVYIVYRFVNDLVYSLGEFVESVPFSLDDYIKMVGEINPVAWANPYNGGQMRQVDWVTVPLCYEFAPIAESIPGITGDNTEKVYSQEFPDLAGNYAFKLADSPVVDTEQRAYIQFYFKQPDGSIGAYLAIGVGPAEFHQGTLTIN
ncbi:MAG: hypothetical protein NTY09_01505 [bacterium]|nr:hypothetical protein [bacterium]